MAWESENRVLASKLEYHIKKDLTKREKEELIQNPNDLERFFGEKLEHQFYRKVNFKQGSKLS